MRLFIALGLAGAVLTGCGANPKPDATVAPALRDVAIVDAVPANATRVGTVKAGGDRWRSESDCRAMLTYEAHRIGANALFVSPASGACEGEAYLVAK